MPLFLDRSTLKLDLHIDRKGAVSCSFCAMSCVAQALGHEPLLAVAWGSNAVGIYTDEVWFKKAVACKSNSITTNGGRCR
jgi:hypothetical protein